MNGSSTVSSLAASRLEQVRGVASHFHPPIANNYVHMLVPLSRELAGYIRRIADSTSSLNRADESLLERCAALLALYPDRAAEQALAAWRECIRKRVNLQGIQWAPAVVAHLESPAALGMPVGDHLRRHDPATLDRFRRIPRSLVELVRVNAYLAPRRIDGMIEQLVELIEANALAAPIERLEVARLAQDVERSAPDFPTLIVYVDGSASSAAIGSTVATLVELFATLAPEGEVRRELAHPLSHNTTVTQGFTLYTRYLRMLGILDELYDSAFDHALCKHSRLAPFLGISRGTRGISSADPSSWSRARR